VLALAPLVACASSFGATQVFNRTIDANAIVANGDSGIDWSAPSFTLSVGDHLQLNYSFMPGQRLSIANPSGIWGVVNVWNDGTPQDVFFDQSMSFVGLQGPGQDVASNASSTSGWGIVAVFDASQFATGPGSMSFTGVQFDIVVTGYSGGLTQRDYQYDFMVAFGDSMSVVAVPEPSQVALWLCGLVGIGAPLYRRKRTALRDC
jgi:hypothetical protein